MQGEYGLALEYANDNKERYEQLKQGRTADDMMRDKIKKQEDAIKLS